MSYKGYDYEPFGNGFTVFFDGDEIFFDTEKEVQEFIDSQVQR